MNNEFITRAIENDRYLKAIRLINRFETEIRGELERVAEEFVRENSELFVDGPEPSWNNSRSSGRIIAFARVDYPMERISSTAADADRLTLNTAIRWLDPAKYGHPDTDGALCVVSYKIKNCPRDDYERIKEQTLSEDWGINFCQDAFSSAPGVLYVPVESAEEITTGFETLKKHFSTYVSDYGVEPGKAV